MKANQKMTKSQTIREDVMFDIQLFAMGYWNNEISLWVELSNESWQKWKTSNQQDVLLLNAADSSS